MATRVGGGTALTGQKGRGRGRGMLATKFDTAVGTQGIKSKSAKEIVREVQEGYIKSSIEYLTRPPVSATGYQGLLDETVNEICDRVLENLEFVEIAAEFFQMLWDSPIPENASIRKPLLIRIQKMYEGRDNLNDNGFQSYASLLCELFNRLKINGDGRLTVLVEPVYNVLKDFLKRGDKSTDNILTFHLLMCKFGPLLEEKSKVKMADLVASMRELALSEAPSKTRKIQLCVILEIIELFASNWEQSEEVKKYYCDTLADLMTEI